MKEIVNRKEIVEELAELLWRFDWELNPYQTDVYLYVDDEGHAKLDTFVNIGGYRWRNDDHYTIYSDRQHCEDIMECFSEIDEIVEAIGIEWEELKQMVADEEGIEDVKDVGHCELAEYAEKNHYDKLLEAYKEYIREVIDYTSMADDILDKWERVMEDEGR